MLFELVSIVCEGSFAGERIELLVGVPVDAGLKFELELELELELDLTFCWS